MTSRALLHFGRFVTVLVLLAGLSRVASAQDYDEAGRHFASGQERFSTKRFHTAALEFQAAYDITKDPVLLYNVGEAWQKAGQSKKAVAAYRGYLKERPTAQDRADVERRIVALSSKKDKAIDQSVPGDTAEAEAMLAPPATPPPPVAVAPPVAETQPPPPVVEVAPTPPVVDTPPPVAVTEAPPAKPTEPRLQVGILDDHPSSKLRIAAWCTVAAAIALVTTGAILGLAAQSRADEITRRLNFVDSSGQPSQFDAAAQSDYNDLRNEGKLYNNLAIGFYSAAGATAIAATVLFVVDYKHKKKREREQQSSFHVSPTIGRGAAGMVLGGSF